MVEAVANQMKLEKANEPIPTSAVAFSDKLLSSVKVQPADMAPPNISALTSKTSLSQMAKQPQPVANQDVAATAAEGTGSVMDALGSYTGVGKLAGLAVKQGTLDPAESLVAADERLAAENKKLTAQRADAERLSLLQRTAEQRGEAVNTGFYTPFVGDDPDLSEGGKSTESLITVTMPDGKLANVPSTWVGAQRKAEVMDATGAMDTAAEYERLSGTTFERFATGQEAAAAIKDRDTAPVKTAPTADAANEEDLLVKQAADKKASLDATLARRDIAKVAVDTGVGRPTQTWWLNSSQVALRSGLMLGTDTVRSLAGLGELIEASATGTEPQRAEARAVLDGIDKELTKILPGDSVQAKDFVTELSSGAGSMAAFMIGGVVGRAMGYGAAVGSGVLGSLSTAGEMYDDADKHGATLTNKYLTLLAGAGIGATEAVPIDRMFLRAERATGGAVTELLKHTVAGSLEEFTQELVQSLSQDQAAQVLYDPDRKVDLNQALRNAAVGGILGGAAGGGVSMMVHGKPKTGEEVRLSVEATQALAQQVHDRAQEDFDTAVPADEKVTTNEETGAELPQEETADAEAEVPQTDAAEPVDIAAEIEGEKAVVQQAEAEAAAEPEVEVDPVQAVKAAAVLESLGIDPAAIQSAAETLVSLNEQEAVALTEKEKPLPSIEKAPQAYKGGTVPALRSDGKVELTHWSNEPLSTLDPVEADTRTKQSTPEMKRAGDPNWVPRVYYGVDAHFKRPSGHKKVQNYANKTGTPGAQSGLGYVNEGLSGPYRHTVAIDPDRLYNYIEDPMGLDAKVTATTPGERATQKEKLIKDAGFDGIWFEKSPVGAAATVFAPLPVESVHQDHTNQWVKAPPSGVPLPKNMEKGAKQPVGWYPSPAELAKRVQSVQLVESDTARLEDLPPSSTGPIERVVKAARAYAADRGIRWRKQSSYVRADPERGARIAREYENMEHNPNDPEVKRAFEAMIEETLAQYQYVKASGLKVEFIEPGMEDPYGGDLKKVHADLAAGHLWTFPTDQGFGTLTEADASNPLLRPTDEMVDGRRLLANDVFRIVHDFFGHGMEGSGFSARGEENAWQSHMRLYSEAAVPAVTSETRGQNSWVNFGPHGEANRANPKETIYADQKTGLMPSWTWREGVEDDVDGMAAMAVGDTKDAFKRWFKDSKIVDEDGNPLVVYHGTPAKFSSFSDAGVARDGGFFGKGHYFTPDLNEAEDYAIDEDGEPGTVVPAFLSVQNPYVINLSYDAWASTKAELAARGVASAAKAEDSAFGASTYNMLRDEPAAFTKSVKAEGFDGVMILNNSGVVEVVAFHPSQIKHATDNSGKFDPENDSILAMTANNRAAYVGEQVRPAKGIRDASTDPTPATDNNLTAIGNNLLKLIGATVRTGRLMKVKGIQGQYNFHSGILRMKSRDDLSTLVHEAGHAMHDIRSAVVEQFIDRNEAAVIGLGASLYPKDLSNADTDVQRKEGFAEFFRIFTLNRDYARKRFPTLTNGFEAMLNREDSAMLKGLDAIGVQFHAWMNAPSTQLVKSYITSSAQPGRLEEMFANIKDQGFGGYIHDKVKWALEGGVNKYIPLDELVTGLISVSASNNRLVDLKRAYDPRALARLAVNSSSRAMVQIKDGVMEYQGTTATTAGLQQAIMISQGLDRNASVKAFNQDRLDDFDAYLVAKRAIVEYDNQDIGDLERAPVGFKRGDAERAIIDYERKYGQSFKQAAQLVHEYGMALWKKSFDAGMMLESTYQEGLKRTFYVPLLRDMSDRGRSDLGPSVLTRGETSIVKRFRGSDRNIVSPLETLMQKTFALEKTIMENDVKKSLAVLSGKAGTGAGEFAERIPAKQLLGSSFSVNEVAKALMKDENIGEVEAQDLIDILTASMETGAMVTMFRSDVAQTLGENIVFYWDEGKLQALQLKDGDTGKAVVNLMHAIGQDNIPLGLEVLSAASTAFRSAITLWPDFAIVNYIRDQASAWILTDVGYKPFWTGAKGIKNEIQQNRLARDYNAFMGTMGGANVAAVHEAKIDQELDSLKSRGYIMTRFREPGLLGFAKGMAELTSITETGTRLGIFESAYNRAKAEGLSDYEAGIEAAYIATDYINFSQHGSRTMVVRRMITFLNAAVQGFYKQARAMGGNDARQRIGFNNVLKAYLKGVNGMELTRTEKQDINTGRGVWIKMSAIALIGAAIAFAYKDDEDYQGISEYMRNTNWVIPTGQGRFIAIPKPFQLAIFSNFVERAIERANGDDKAMKRFMNGVQQMATLPMENPLTGTAWELWMNKDTFTGQDIVPGFMQSLPPELQYNQYTSELAKQIGKMTGMSAMKVDFLLDGIGASASRDLKTLSGQLNPDSGTMDPTDAPILRRFYRDSTRGNAASVDFWEQASNSNGRLRQAERGYKHYVDVGNEAAANRFLQGQDDDAKVYALLNTTQKVDAKRLHPMVRARQYSQVVSEMRREIASDIGIDDTATGTRVRLSPKMKTDADNLLSELVVREIRNTMITTEAPGWKGKKKTDNSYTMDVLRQQSPELADELDRRLDKAGVYNAAVVEELWPDLKDRLLQDREEAVLSDLVSIAKSTPR
jgi:hypothetical protein